ncbi:MAG: RsmB/NOP family class I SAM-dependent RNA methyltransferase [Myxococcota bacterium]|nr:RsmB/NOP family class I SAM-dependent RNA methyltransferase [Myxococcota bacterium]
MKRSVKRGPEAFRDFYREEYGQRWDRLEASLSAPKQYVARLNTFAATPRHGLPDTAQAADWNPACMIVEESVQVPNDVSPLPFFLMDGASVLAAEALDAQPGDSLLDVCAAPGGKSLILAEKLGDTGTLTSNDRSAHRRERLKRVIADYIPANVRERIRVTGHDASRWCLHEEQAFDKILVDAPCSSERHVLADAKELAQWTPARTKQLAQRQYAILASAMRVVRVGGRVVYSTCALSQRENDGVIAKLMRKRKGEASSVHVDCPLGEETEYGQLILPDETGFGPIYFAVLERHG